MLADHLADYLFARSTGHIGSLMTLVSRGCQRAIRPGAERRTCGDQNVKKEARDGQPRLVARRVAKEQPQR